MDTRRKRDNVAIITIGTEPNSLLASDLGKELHHPIISMLWGRERQRKAFFRL